MSDLRKTPKILGQYLTRFIWWIRYRKCVHTNGQIVDFLEEPRWKRTGANIYLFDYDTGMPVRAAAIEEAVISCKCRCENCGTIFIRKLLHTRLDPASYR